MDTVLQIIKARRSIRSFQEREIPQEILKKIKDALLWAPSAGNLQARKFYFIKDKNIKRKLAESALGQYFIAKAPLVLVGCADSRIEVKYGQRGVNLYAIQDVACSIMNMMLVLCENGLGSVWVGAFLEKEVKDILYLPDNLRPVAIVPMGYPAEEPEAPPRVSEKEAFVFLLDS